MQGQVDHTLMIGHRVAAAESDFAEMAARFRDEGFGAEHATGLEQLAKCPACSRALTHGDFGVDHIMYYLDGDDEKKPAKVRSIPRIWCTPCAQRRAKHMRRPYVKSRQVAAWRDEREDFVASVERDQKAGDVILHLDTLKPPAREARGRGRRGRRGRGGRGRGRGGRGGGGGGREAEEQADAAVEAGVAPARGRGRRGQVRVCRQSRGVAGSVDPDRAARAEMRVEYAARTALVSGERRRARPLRRRARGRRGRGRRGLARVSGRACAARGSRRRDAHGRRGGYDAQDRHGREALAQEGRPRACGAARRASREGRVAAASGEGVTTRAGRARGPRITYARVEHAGFFVFAIDRGLI